MYSNTNSCSICKQGGHVATKCPKNPTIPASELSKLMAQASPAKFNIQAANSVDLIVFEVMCTKFGYQRAITPCGCPYLVIPLKDSADVFFMFVGRYGYNIAMNIPSIQSSGAIKGYIDSFEVCKSGLSLTEFLAGGVYAMIPPVAYGGQPYRIMLPYEGDNVLTNFIADFSFTNKF